MIGLSVGQHPKCVFISYICDIKVIFLTLRTKYQRTSNIIKFISYNINGSQNPLKLKKCLNCLKSQQADVSFIQETHQVDSELIQCRREWVGWIFDSSYSSRKCGVAIHVHKKLNFVMMRQHKDNEGRIICVEAKINGININLCNIYMI